MKEFLVGMGIAAVTGLFWLGYAHDRALKAAWPHVKFVALVFFAGLAGGMAAVFVAGERVYEALVARKDYTDNCARVVRSVTFDLIQVGFWGLGILAMYYVAAHLRGLIRQAEADEKDEQHQK